MLLVRPQANLPKRMSAAMIVVALAALILLQRLFVVQVVEGQNTRRRCFSKLRFRFFISPAGLDSGPQWFAFGGKSGSVRR